MAERTAAAALYPHLRSQVSEPRQQPRTGNPIAQAMWPSLAPKPLQPSNPYRDALLRNLREINAKHKR
jgi:hypothetical protein